MTRILIYRAGTLGDTIVALPAINALRRAFPSASFGLVAPSSRHGGLWADTVLREFGWFDAFITYDAAVLRSPRALARLLSRVRAFRADLVVNLCSERNSWLRLLRDRAFFALAGVSRVVGRPSACVTWYGTMRRADRVYPSEVDRLLAIAVDAGGAAGNHPEFNLPLGDATRTRVDGALADAGLAGAPLLVALCPGSKQPAKRWPEDRYGAVCRRLIEEHGAHIVIVGGADERVAGDRLAAGWPQRHWANLAGRLSVLESAELIRRCALYVGNDTGPMHLAASVGTPCVAVFAARCPGGSWFPYGPRHVVLQRQPACRNCFLSTCVSEGSRCLTEIATSEVLQACERTLASSPPRTAGFTA